MMVRNLAQAIREQNWFSVLIEFVIVVAGIFVALQVDSWNEDRKLHILEHEYLVGIAADLESTANGLKQTRDSAIENQAALHQLIDIAEGMPPPPADKFILSLIRSTYLGLPRISDITLKELISTGSLRLIRNNTFKRRLAEFQAEFEYLSQWYPEYRRKEAATELSLKGLIPLEARLDMRDANIAKAAKNLDTNAWARELRGREELVSSLEDSIWTQVRVIMACDRMLKRVEELQTMLADQLER